MPRGGQGKKQSRARARVPGEAMTGSAPARMPATGASPAGHASTLTAECTAEYSEHVNCPQSVRNRSGHFSPFGQPGQAGCRTAGSSPVPMLPCLRPRSCLAAGAVVRSGCPGALPTRLRCVRHAFPGGLPVEALEPLQSRVPAHRQRAALHQPLTRSRPRPTGGLFRPLPRSRRCSRSMAPVAAG